MVRDEEYIKLLEAFKDIYHFVWSMNRSNFTDIFNQIVGDMLVTYEPLANQSIEYLPNQPLNIELRDVDTNELIVPKSIDYNSDHIVIKAQRTTDNEHINWSTTKVDDIDNILTMNVTMQELLREVLAKEIIPTIDGDVTTKLDKKLINNILDVLTTH